LHLVLYNYFFDRHFYYFHCLFNHIFWQSMHLYCIVIVDTAWTNYLICFVINKWEPAREN
jgi:hypothetical protein